MSRNPATYRGARRNAARDAKCLSDWGKVKLFPYCPDSASPHKVVLIRPLPRAVPRPA